MSLAERIQSSFLHIWNGNAVREFDGRSRVRFAGGRDTRSFFQLFVLAVLGLVCGFQRIKLMPLVK
jgi:hypothetical protein